MTDGQGIPDGRRFGGSCFGRCVAEGFAVALLMLFFGIPGTGQAQQLEPRTYMPAPIDLNIIGLSALYSRGGVVTDVASPIQNINADVYTAAPYYARTFGLFGRQANVSLVTPYAWGTITGDVQDVSRSVDRSGFGDPTLRLTMNLLGGPALTPQEFRQLKPETTLGASITVNAPFGQYDSSKLINLGTNRWACKPELGLSQPVGDWVFEFYTGVWLFETNDNFFGGQVRKQDPLGVFQAHIVYNVLPGLWAAADFAYNTGGSTTVDGKPQNDRQDNTRGGLTLSVPITRGQSLKLAWARGVSTRVGSSFETVAVAWQLMWF
jgi:hypothetical protein